MIGMQFGTLIAQMVVIGDLGPSIVATFFGFEVCGLKFVETKKLFKFVNR